MTVAELIAALQEVKDKRALVTFAYDSRVCCLHVTCVDFVPDMPGASPAVVLRAEDRAQYDLHHGEEDDPKPVPRLVRPSHRDGCQCSRCKAYDAQQAPPDPGDFAGVMLPDRTTWPMPSGRP